MNHDETADELGKPLTSLIQTNGSAVPRTVQSIGRKSRAPSWRLRFLVMRRDKFRCRFCGATESATLHLVVDHIVPWAKDGPTIFENLQTLCEPSNGGKSDLPIDSEELI